MKLTDAVSDTVIQRVWDAFSIGTLLGTLLGVLPHIATIVTILWGLIRIYETKTVRKLLGKKPYDRD